MNRYFVINVVLLILLAAPVACVSADYQLAWCRGCQPSDYSAFARAALRAAPVTKEGVYVVNRMSGIVKYFRVTGEASPYEATFKVVPSDGDPDVLSKIHDALSIYKLLHQLASIDQLPGLDPEEAYDSVVDLIGKPQRQDKLSGAINQFVQSRIKKTLDQTTVSDILMRSDSTESKDSSIKPFRELVFPDGSVLPYQIEEVYTSGGGEIALVYCFILRSARDSAGKPVPTQALGLVQRSPITGSSAEDYVNLAVRLGMPVNEVCGASQTEFSCKYKNESSDKRTYLCRYETASACSSSG